MRQSETTIARLAAFALTFLSLLPLSAAAETYLLMAEEDGCVWCQRWNDEIAHIYPKTIEGQIAPLRRYDVHHEEAGVKLIKRVHFTPTFILVDDGQEVGRIEGYPGEDFFWGLLTKMFDRANIPLEKSG